MSETKKTLPLWPIWAVLIVIILLCVLNPLCRYVYTKNFVSRGDEQLAELFADNLEAAGVTSLDKPMFFIGSSETRTNASCLDLSNGKYHIFSIFAAADALELDTVESSRYIVEHLNSMGYQYTAPTAEDWTKYEAEMSEHIPLWKAFPWYESIKETEHCIIVQLTPVDVFG